MKSCAYCGSETYSAFLTGVTDRLRQTREKYSFVSCNGCGSSWIDPLPSARTIRDAYPEIYGFGQGEFSKKRLARLLQAMELKLWFLPVYRRSLRLLVNYHGSTGSLLDVGCGSGYQAACFKSAGYDVTGVDFSCGVSERMMSMHGIKAYECNATDLGSQLSGRRYDVVTAFHVIEHMTDPAAFLDQVLGVLRPGGTLFISAPLAQSVQARLFGKYWGAYREAPRHISLPSRTGLKKLFERKGLSDVELIPDHVFYIAGGAFVSLISALTMTSSYGSSGFGTAVKRFIGAGLAASYLPPAFIESLTFRYSMGIAVGRNAGA